MLNPKKPYLNLEKEKENFCVLFNYSIKRAREVSKFHVTVVQTATKCTKKCDGRAKQPKGFFPFFVAVAVVVAKAPYRP